MTLNGISFSVIFCLFCLFLCFLFLIFVLLEIWSVGRLTIWLRAFSLATYLPYRELNPSTLKIILNIHVNFLYTTHFKQIPSSLECCSNKHHISFTTQTNIISPLQHLLDEHERVLSKVNPTVAPLLVPHVTKLKEALDPLLTSLTWSSIQAHSFFDQGFAAIHTFQILIDRWKMGLSTLWCSLVPYRQVCGKMVLAGKRLGSVDMFGLLLDTD